MDRHKENHLHRRRVRHGHSRYFLADPGESGCERGLNRQIQLQRVTLGSRNHRQEAAGRIHHGQALEEGEPRSLSLQLVGREGPLGDALREAGEEGAARLDEIGNPGRRLTAELRHFPRNEIPGGGFRQ